MPVPKLGAGTSFSYCDTIGGTYLPLASIITMTPAKISTAKLPIDCFDNATLPNGLPISNSAPGWVTPGMWVVKLLYKKGQFGLIRALVGTELYYKVIKTDATGYTFQGYISDFGEEIPLKDWMSVEVTVEVNGGSIAALSDLLS